MTPEAFLEAICASPEDDLPRLVFADWLDEHGGPAEQARAEFIRIQCQRARLPEHAPQQAELDQREKVLLDQHGGAWLAELPVVEGLTWGRFARGFVGAVLADAEAFVALAAKLPRLAPISELTVHVESDEQVWALRGSPTSPALLTSLACVPWN